MSSVSASCVTGFNSPQLHYEGIRVLDDSREPFFHAGKRCFPRFLLVLRYVMDNDRRCHEHAVYAIHRYRLGTGTLTEGREHEEDIEAERAERIPSMKRMTSPRYARTGSGPGVCEVLAP